MPAAVECLAAAVDPDDSGPWSLAAMQTSRPPARAPRHRAGTHQCIDYRRIGAYNDEISIMQEILTRKAGRPDPTLVPFFTGGGFPGCGR